MSTRRHPTEYLGDEYARLVRESLNWELKELQSASEPLCTVDGKQVIMLCANNYLNLATHPKLVNAMVEATKNLGAGAGSDRSIAGNMTLHEELDSRLAEFKKAPASAIVEQVRSDDLSGFDRIPGELVGPVHP